MNNIDGFYYQWGEKNGIRKGVDAEPDVVGLVMWKEVSLSLKEVEVGSNEKR